MSERAVTWTGRPNGFLRFRSYDAPVITLGLATAYFGVSFMVATRSVGVPPEVLAYASTLTAVGLWLGLFRLIARGIRLRKTAYQIAEGTLEIRSGLWVKRTRQLRLPLDVAIERHKDDTGTLSAASSDGPRPDALLEWVTDPDSVAERLAQPMTPAPAEPADVG